MELTPFSTARNFAGSIDEVAIFNRALSQTELLAMYTAASGVSAYPPSIAGNPVWTPAKVYAGMSATITAPLVGGSAPFSYKWLAAVPNSGVYSLVTDGAATSGSTTAMLTISNAQVSKDYLVVVSNPVASVAQCAAVTYALASQVPGGAPVTNSISLLARNNIATLLPDTAPSSPVIAKIAVSGQNVILGGTNGVANATYNILSTTNLATPLVSWTTIGTNVFDINGNFTIANAIMPGVLRTFYRLQVKQ